MATRKQLFEKAQKTGVEILEWRQDNCRIFQAWAPEGKTFKGSTCHSTQLGEILVGEKPNWKWMMNEIELVDCDEKDCDYCSPLEEE
tara:strand:+ start:593 stop:853 length:261 start_codon:yes stop_codon:yes gene_type:complete